MTSEHSEMVLALIYISPCADNLTGLILATDNIPAILAASKPPTPQRHFSAFPLTSHLHSPAIRLVSLHPLLRVTLQCTRIPGIDEDFEFEWFLARTTTVEEALNAIIEEIGLPKFISGPGGGHVDYVMEEAWVSDEEDEGGMPICADIRV